MTEFIHPKTGTVREVPETNQNKIALLKRAGYVPKKGYKAPKPPEIVAEPSLAEAVEDNKVDLEDVESDGSEPEIAIHISGPARAMVEKNDLDPADIKGSGKDGQITKTDVKNYLKALEEEKAPEAQESAEDVIPPDDAQKPGEAPEIAPGDDSVEDAGFEAEPE